MGIQSRLFFAAICLFLPALSAAGDFETDLKSLRYALQFSRFSDRDLEKFQDPTRGRQEYRLGPDRAPWAGNYFPMADGGIAHRWQTPSTQIRSGDKVGDTREYFQNMSPSLIAQLSPVEKYDLLRGRYDFPATKYELQNRGPRRDMKPESWEGFCNGVRCAGINLREPKYPVVMTNPDGIRILFEPADLKALSGASYFYVEKYAQMGAPSREGRHESQPNAAAFDLILRFFVGEKRKAFVIDSHLGSEIWNESVIGYKREVSAPEELTPEERRGRLWAKSKVTVKGYLETLGEIDIVESNLETRERVAAGEIAKQVNIKYTLYLDASGQARDGEWQNHGRYNRGVDFVWFGGGGGDDASYRNGGPRRESLDFSVIRRLFGRSQKPQCSRVLLTQ